MFIHKSKKPRCFKHMDMNSLPVHYYSQKKAWMDTKLFEQWFHDRFVPHVKKYCEENKISFKILLFLDNAPAHPSTETLQSRDGNVKVMFLPPNTTSILQPMDQGILEAMKRRYKKSLLRHLILENASSTLSIPNLLKALTIKEVVYWSAQAWEGVPEDTLKRGWNKLLKSSGRGVATVSPSSTGADASTGGSAEDDSAANGPSSASGTGGSSSGPDYDEFMDLFQQMGYTSDDDNWQAPEEWLGEDASDPGYHMMTDDEIISEVMDAEESYFSSNT